MGSSLYFLRRELGSLMRKWLSRNTKPLFIASSKLLISQIRMPHSIMVDIIHGTLQRRLRNAVQSSSARPLDDATRYISLSRACWLRSKPKLVFCNYFRLNELSTICMTSKTFELNLGVKYVIRDRTNKRIGQRKIANSILVLARRTL